VYTGFRWVNLRKRDHLEDPGIDWRIILRWIFMNCNVRAWTESISQNVVMYLQNAGNFLTS